MVPNNPTGVWLGDYTVQPENGGLGVFAHEYGHDLGLPDLYDTSGNTGGAENTTAFWTLMSSGANIGDGSPDGIGDAPTDLGAWERFQLGWLNAAGQQRPVLRRGHRRPEVAHIKLGPNTPATKSPQALFIVLPDKQVTAEPRRPVPSGCTYFYSGHRRRPDSTVTMTHDGRPAPRAHGQGPLRHRGGLRLRLPRGLERRRLRGSRSRRTCRTADGPERQQPDAAPASPAPPRLRERRLGRPHGDAAGRDHRRALPYQTDRRSSAAGFQVDAIAVGGTAVAGRRAGRSTASSRPPTGVETQAFFNAYVAENRQYDGYDASLKTAYNFGFLNTRPDWVETYPYQNGLLVSYWDDSQTDNNVGDHPGRGLILPVDAHPTFPHWPNGDLMRQRILSYDSTFGTEKTDAITLHNNSVAATIPSQKAVPTFDDTKTWWFDCDQHACTGSHQGRYQPGWTGVDVPKTGTTITVNGATTGSHLNITVAPK